MKNAQLIKTDNILLNLKIILLILIYLAYKIDFKIVPLLINCLLWEDSWG